MLRVVPGGRTLLTFERPENTIVVLTNRARTLLPETVTAPSRCAAICTSARVPEPSIENERSKPGSPSVGARAPAAAA